MTNCGCVPHTPTNGDNININHTVNGTNHLTVSNGSVFTVGIYGKYNGVTFDMSVLSGASLELTGHCKSNRLFHGTGGALGGTINIYYSIVEVNGRVDLSTGTTTLEGYLYLPVGNFTVEPNATFITTSSAKLELFAGNIENKGNIEICEDCCVTTTGNWRNHASSVVTGSGSATSSAGNMRNSGSFSNSISWCSAGSDSGMPGFEDCASSNTTCGAIMLPVELIDFRGAPMLGFNKLTWSTATENGCRNFTITYSTDGLYWETIGTVTCSGNSTEMMHYSFDDYEHTSGVSYYRLEQVDYNGDITYSNLISVTQEDKKDLLVYPNPVKSGNELNITGTSDGGTLNIFGPTGSLINQTNIKSVTGSTTTINTSNLTPGVYLVVFTTPSSGVARSKFVVQ